MSEPLSSPPSGATSVEAALAWYKAQYEQLESELSEFQASSKELEAELEKDLDTADKRERGLREKAEELSFEVEGWKRKYRESKAEANAAQNTLEKEITTLRDANRTLQLRLRDTEVANDDFERQARNTTSSLEDLESKYNVAIERAVMMEEEIRIGEQEREQLRVEAQRLREELSDLKIEAEILQDKLKKQESRHLSTISTDVSVLGSSTFDQSPHSTASSPLITTPPDSKSASTAGTASDVIDPPSPPMSDAPASLSRSTTTTRPAAAAPGARKPRLPSSADHAISPKPKLFSSSTTRTPGARVATVGSGNLRTPANRTPRSKALRTTGHKIPPSNSLTHIRTLTAQMQRLEARVHSARSKLPGPVSTPPRASPRSLVLGISGIPSTVTIRSRKRAAGAGTASSSATGDDEATPTGRRNGEAASFRSSTSAAAGGKSHMSRLSSSGVSRLSFGPRANRHPADPDSSRPSSRTSMSSHARSASRTESHHDPRTMPPPRPTSRASLGRAPTPLGGRPRSSLGGSVYGHNQSIGYSTAELDETTASDDAAADSQTPSRRGTCSRLDADGAGHSGIPVPRGARRQSGSGVSIAGSRRSSSGLRDPAGMSVRSQKLADLGETY